MSASQELRILTDLTHVMFTNTLRPHTAITTPNSIPVFVDIFAETIRCSHIGCSVSTSLWMLLRDERQIVYQTWKQTAERCSWQCKNKRGNVYSNELYSLPEVFPAILNLKRVSVLIYCTQKRNIAHLFALQLVNFTCCTQKSVSAETVMSQQYLYLILCSGLDDKPCSTGSKRAFLKACLLTSTYVRGASIK